MRKSDKIEKKQIKENITENTEKKAVEEEKIMQKDLNNNEKKVKKQEIKKQKKENKKTKHYITKTEIINRIIATCLVIVMVFAVVATIIFYLKYYV